MKNTALKSLLILVISLFGIYSTNALTDQSLFVKLSASPDGDYNTTIDVVNNNGTELNFKVQTVMEPMGTGSYSIAFPAGFEYVSNSLTVNDGACTGNTVTSATNTTFTFDVAAIGTFCVYDYILTYTITNSVGEGTEQVLIIGGTNSSVSIGITSQNTITKTETIDSDDNGYIDQYRLTFSTGGLVSFSNTNLIIGTLTPTLSSITDNIVYLNFTDDTYATGDKPQIIDTDGNIFTGIGIIEALTVSEEDKAAPIILTINGTNIVGVANPSINVSGNSKIVINFSEKMSSATLLTGFTIKEDNIDKTNSAYITFNENDGDTMYYCLGGYDGGGNCIDDFDSSKSYSINISNTSIDLNSNSYNGGAIDIDIIVDDTTPPVASSVTYNSETNNAIVINGISGSNNYTSSAAGTVNISIGGTDNNGTVQDMCVSEDSLLTNDNVCDTGWEAYNTTKSFTFTGTEGLNTLYLKFRDPSGNISNVYSDSIIWDKSNPISSASPNGGFFVNGSSTVTMNCTDSITSCSVIYYTTDGSAPTIASTQIVSGNTIVIAGNDETKTLKFFSEDIVGNQEGSTNSVDFTFGDSYVTFTAPTSETTSNNITLTGSCNYALGGNSVEYSIDGSSYSAVTTDTCDASNTWSNDFVLTSNSSNNLVVRLTNDASISTNINVIHDNTAPSGESITINNGDTYSSSNNVTLTISSTDTNGVDEMCISTDSGLTNDSVCNSSIWETYSNSDSYSFTGGDGTKTAYIKFRDSLGNVSTVTSDSIIVDSSTPTVTANLASGTYQGTKTVTITSPNTIYYTLDGSNPTDTSTLYTTPLSFGSTSETVILKIIAYSASSQTSSVGTYNYTFGCSPSSVSNGSVSVYPTCAISCNSGYSISGSSCVADSVPSGGGGGSSGGGGASEIVDYEDIKFISRIKIIPESIIENQTLVKYGVLDISNLSTKQITGVNGIINLRASLRSESHFIIPENTSIETNAKLISAPYSIDIPQYLELKTIKVQNIDFKSYNVKKLYFAGNTEKNVEFDTELDLYFDMGDKVIGKLNVYYSESIDGNFELIKSGLSTDEDGMLNFKKNKLGYFVFIRDLYVNRYLGGQVNLGIASIEDVQKIIYDLKLSVSNEILKSIITKYGKKLEILEIYKYLEFDTGLQTEYSGIVSGFSDFITYLNKYILSKSDTDRNAAIVGYKKFLKVSELKDFKNRYIKKTIIDGIEINRTNYEKISVLLSKLETILLAKYKKLLDSKTISEASYNDAINEYNNFIYNYTIFKQFNHKDSGLKVMTGIKKILSTYKMVVGSKVVVEEPVVTKILIKDKYSFPKELSYGMYNQEVQNLQEIMKSYGYFTHPQTTMYFGSVTKESFVNFSKGVLGTSNSDGILTKDLIEKLYLIEYKQ